MRHEAEILAVLEAGADLTLATLMPDGSPHATTVSYASQGMAVYFGSSRRSRSWITGSASATSITSGPQRSRVETLGGKAARRSPRPAQQLQA